MNTPGLMRQKSAHGIVNVEILRLFEDYSNRSSWVRVMVICSFSMAPAFLTLLLIELMSLAPLEDGWVANWVFWIRCFLSGLCVSLSICAQFHTLVPAAGLSARPIWFISISATLGYVVGLLPLANFWGFPVPFTIVTGTPLWYFILASGSVAAIGLKKLHDNQILRKQLRVFLSTIVIQCLMTFAYPAYNAGYIALSGNVQLLFILVLSVIKYFTKWLLNRVAGQTEAGAVLVMISADLFKALYLLKCMQSANSVYSGLVLIIVDVVHNFIQLRGLYRRVQELEESISQNGLQLDKTTLIRSFIQVSTSSFNYSISPNVIYPQPATLNELQPEMEQGSHSKVDDIHDSTKKLESIFLRCQEVLLVEYVEAIVPVYFLIYLEILFHLPNATYYPEMRTMTAEKLSHLERNIAVYAGFDMLSIVFVHLILKRRLNLSAFHLLAFTLETQKTILQSIFFALVMICMQYTLAHYGKNSQSLLHSLCKVD